MNWLFAWWGRWSLRRFRRWQPTIDAAALRRACEDFQQSEEVRRVAERYPPKGRG